MKQHELERYVSWRARARIFCFGALSCASLVVGSCGAHEEPAMSASTEAAPGPVGSAPGVSSTPADAGAAADTAQATRSDSGSAPSPSVLSRDASAPADGAAPVASSDEFLGLAAPAEGFRVKTRGAEIPAGGDHELCEVQEVPGAPGQEYVVGTVEVANGRASHHLIVSAAQADTAADKLLRSLPLGTQVPCVSAAIEFGDGLISIGASQTTLAKSVYPEGVGLRLKGGQRLVFDYHYFNFTEAPLMATSAAAFHTLPPAKVHNIASTFSFTNMTIDTAPGSRGTFVAACRFKHDVMLHALGRHTHTQGTDFTVWYDGGPNHGQQIWQSLDWEHDTTFPFPQPLLFKADQGFKFACSFRNETRSPLRFGIRAQDEMCILTGAIWSPTPNVEIAPEACVITWVDAQGVGHDARDDGGFPKPTSDDVLACTLDTIGFSFLDSCVSCICDHCAAPLTRCNADADCKAIVDCRLGCQGEGAKCDESCEATLLEHSSGVGMGAQVGECITAECAKSCSLVSSQ